MGYSARQNTRQKRERVTRGLTGEHEPATAAERKQLIEWAKRAMHGLDESHVFIGILDNRPLNAARVAFTLQLGHCVLEDKLIILPVPHGVELPKKLAAVADEIVRYNPGDLESLQRGLEKALRELGVNKQ